MYYVSQQIMVAQTVKIPPVVQENRSACSADSACSANPGLDPWVKKIP